MGKSKGKQPAKGNSSGKQKGDSKNNKSEQLKGGKLNSQHILVKKLTLAQELRDELAAGADFAELARKHSQCSSKNKGGKLGPKTKQDLVAPYWNAGVKLKVGQISEPVKTQFGYHLIKRLK